MPLKGPLSPTEPLENPYIDPYKGRVVPDYVFSKVSINEIRVVFWEPFSVCAVASVCGSHLDARTHADTERERIDTENKRERERARESERETERQKEKSPDSCAWTWTRASRSAPAPSFERVIEVGVYLLVWGGVTT